MLKELKDISRILSWSKLDKIQDRKYYFSKKKEENKIPWSIKSSSSPRIILLCCFE